MQPWGKHLDEALDDDLTFIVAERLDSPIRKCGQFTVCANRFGATFTIQLPYN
jgi:hypothetical protein